MGRTEKDSLPVEVDHLKHRVHEWRRSRVGYSPMPVSIWDAAIHLAERFGVCRISRAVGVDYTGLRKQVAKARAKPTPLAFVELPVRGVMTEQRAQGSPEACWPPNPGSVIDISTADGARLRISLEGGRSLDAAGIVESFLGHHA